MNYYKKNLSIAVLLVSIIMLFTLSHASDKVIYLTNISSQSHGMNIKLKTY